MTETRRTFVWQTLTGAFSAVLLVRAHAAPAIDDIATEKAAVMHTSPSQDQIIRHLRHSNQIAKQAMAAGHHPFGAVLVAPDHETVVMTQGNINTVQHAESELARRAAAELSAEELWQHTLYSSVEPCAMCAGTQYWANIGRLVYGISERELLAMTGAHEENPTLDVPSRYVFEQGQKQVEVIGPVAEVQEEIAALHRGFWD